MKSKEFTGWHMAAITCTGFAIIIGVNLTLAFQAVATFPGVETRNSYVASQKFDAAREAQDALMWTVKAQATTEHLTLTVHDQQGHAVQPENITATLGRATHQGEDQTPEFTWDAAGYSAPVTLKPGYWNLRLVMQAGDGTQFQRRIPLTVSQVDE